MKKLLKKISYILDEATYLIPHVFLVLYIMSLFDEIKVDSWILLLCYLSTAFGEYSYMKYKNYKEAVYRIADSINDAELVTLDGLNRTLEEIDKSIDERIDGLRSEIKGDAFIGKMDSEKSQRKLR